MLRFLSGGESHGKCLTAVIEGIPANFQININDINVDLAKRQQGYGRGGRMSIEKDALHMLSGVRNSYTTGSPITLQIFNKDWENWAHMMDPSHCANMENRKVTKPRPGHADLSGAIKYDQTDIRNILERASARETAIRTAIGALCRQILISFGITVMSHVIQIGKVKAPSYYSLDRNTLIADIKNIVDKSPVRCIDKNAEKLMMLQIDKAKNEGDSLGGIFEIIAVGVPPGIGSHVHWDRKLDAKLSYAIMSIQAVKGVEVGLGFTSAGLMGSKVHDEIYYDDGYYRKTNNAGGIEGGISNGEDIVIKAAMKPIPTLYKPLNSIDIRTKHPYKASVERSDNCAVPAAGIVGEAVVCWTLLECILEKFGGDSSREVLSNYKSYLEGGEET